MRYLFSNSADVFRSQNVCLFFTYFTVPNSYKCVVFLGEKDIMKPQPPKPVTGANGDRTKTLNS